MPRGRKTTQEAAIPAHSMPSPTTRDHAGGPFVKPSPADCTAYDQLVLRTSQLQELTGCEGWSLFFGELLAEAVEARASLETAEKTRDLLKLQAIIALVKHQKKKLQQPVDDLNHLRGRWPLFTGELPWRADFDETSGRVTLIWEGQGQPPELASAQPIPSPSSEVEDPASVPGPGGPPTADPDEEEELDGEDPDPDDPFGD